MATGKSNYVAWEFRILGILKEKGLARALENAGDNADGDAADLGAREWVNDQAFTIISLNIRDSQIPHIQAARNAKVAWCNKPDFREGVRNGKRLS